MRRFLVSLVFLFATIAASSAAPAATPREIEATVIRVADGDTLTAETTTAPSSGCIYTTTRLED
jgi:endonuclease YncB( thermonuclease family)